MRNVLFVCSKNQWRSPTAEKIWKNHPDISVRSAGTSSSARYTIQLSDIKWAHEIIVMESKHEQRIRSDYPDAVIHKNIHVLDIPDNYRFMDPALVEELEYIIPAILDI